jgi:hypothetical protein
MGLRRGAGDIPSLTRRAADCLQRPLRSRFRQQLTPGVRHQHLPGFIACCILSHFEIS